ncbi:hypothetical protein V5O48_010001 [Marasmius crinis-equi]|uniref:Uncharacterized protein n=1 Tax=Marasmius crinis-equi TaxID=585013 RepID=A0ABR3F9P4_9AGAR
MTIGLSVGIIIGLLLAVVILLWRRRKHSSFTNKKETEPEEGAVFPYPPLGYTSFNEKRSRRKRETGFGVGSPIRRDESDVDGSSYYWPTGLENGDRSPSSSRRTRPPSVDLPPPPAYSEMN